MPSIIREDKIGIASFHHSVLSMSGEMVCTLGFFCDNDNVQENADKAAVAWTDAWIPILSSKVTYVKTTVIQMVGTNLESADAFVGAPMVGTGSPDMFPANVAILIQKRTALAGRKNRGRFYVGGVGQSWVNPSVDPNALTPASLTSWQTRADLFYTNLTDATPSPAINPMILHPLPGAQATEVTAFSVQARLATQRNRLRD